MILVGSEVLVFSQPARREEAEDRRKVAGDQAVGDRGCGRYLRRHTDRGQTRGQRGLADADAARYGYQSDE